MVVAGPRRPGCPRPPASPARACWPRCGPGLARRAAETTWMVSTLNGAHVSHLSLQPWQSVPAPWAPGPLQVLSPLRCPQPQGPSPCVAPYRTFLPVQIPPPPRSLPALLPCLAWTTASSSFSQRSAAPLLTIRLCAPRGSHSKGLGWRSSHVPLRLLPTPSCPQGPRPY